MWALSVTGLKIQYPKVNNFAIKNIDVYRFFSSLAFITSKASQK